MAILTKRRIAKYRCSGGVYPVIQCIFHNTEVIIHGKYSYVQKWCPSNAKHEVSMKTTENWRFHCSRRQHHECPQRQTYSTHRQVAYQKVQKKKIYFDGKYLHILQLLCRQGWSRYQEQTEKQKHTVQSLSPWFTFYCLRDKKKYPICFRILFSTSYWFQTLET